MFALYWVHVWSRASADVRLRGAVQGVRGEHSGAGGDVAGLVDCGRVSVVRGEAAVSAWRDIPGQAMDGLSDRASSAP